MGTFCGSIRKHRRPFDVGVVMALQRSHPSITLPGSELLDFNLFFIHAIAIFDVYILVVGLNILIVDDLRLLLLLFPFISLRF